MNVTRLNPPIPVEVKDYGSAEAIAIFDYGQDEDIQWLVFLNKDGQSLFVSSSSIKKSGYIF